MPSSTCAPGRIQSTGRAEPTFWFRSTIETHFFCPPWTRASRRSVYVEAESRAVEEAGEGAGRRAGGRRAGGDRVHPRASSDVDERCIPAQRRALGDRAVARRG